MKKNLIELSHISKTFDDSLVLDDLCLEVKENEFLTLLGPSGCGKTTTLRIIGGFETPDQGKVIFEGKDITNLQPNQRNLNTVFQKYALFTHMTIEENIAFGLKIKKKSASYIRDKVKYALKLVNLEGYEHRKPTSLSGGQQQRIAIARALATDPKVLLCDEATSALDPRTTHQILSLIRSIHDQLGITVIIITHQMSVVEEICNRVAILDEGQVAEEGEVAEIFSSPKSRAAKRLVYPEGFADTEEIGGNDHKIRVVFNGAQATEKPLIATMAIEEHIAASIDFASTRNLGGRSYGTMILGIEGDDQVVQRALTYLRKNEGIRVEEIR